MEGRASVLLTSPGGEIKVAELGQNALVGEMGILSDNPRSATIVAAQPIPIAQSAQAPAAAATSAFFSSSWRSSRRWRSA